MRSLLEQILTLLREIQASIQVTHVEHETPSVPPIPQAPVVPVAPVPAPVVQIPTTVVKTKREVLYEVAKGCLGKSMVSPGISPDLGCASSVNNVFKKAFGVEAGGGSSTAEMLRVLTKDKRFKEVKNPLPGDIVLNATGTSTKGVAHGHVGIRGNTDTMSNNSANGVWSAHYTNKGWEDFFAKMEGFPTRYFRIN